MPVFVDAYQTSIARAWKPDSIREALKKAEVMGELETVEGTRVYAVTRGVETPPFTHPIVFVGRDRTHRVCVDLRPYLSANGEVPVNQRPEYNLQIVRARLSDAWVNSGKDYFTAVQDTTLKLFVKWVSSSVAKRFSLNMQDIMIMEVVLAFYYLNLFNDDEVIGETRLLDIINRIVKVLGFPVPFVAGVLEGTETPINSVEGLTQVIRLKTDSIRLKDMNSGVLFTIVARSWFGHNAPEIIAASLEHIPSFYALVYSAIQENIYRKTGFAQAVEVVMKKDKVNTAQGIRNLMELG